MLDFADLQADLVCSVCQDWMVQSANIECSHSFCWACVDTWLLQKKFECPVCRHAVTREPVRSRALDAIVQNRSRMSTSLVSSPQKKRTKRPNGCVTSSRKA